MYKFQDNFQKNQTEEILQSFRKYNGTVRMDLVRKQVLGLSLASPKTHSMFSKNLNSMYARATLQSSITNTPSLPLPEKRCGDIVIGTLVQGPYEYGTMMLPVDSFTHTCCLGANGTGKSTLEWNITKQLVERRCNTITFDRKKDMRNLLNVIQLVILDANDLRINIFDPPDVKINPRTWISKVCDLFTIFGIYYSSRNFIKEFVINLYDETKEIPTIFDVFNEIKNKNERGQTRGNYKEASLNKIENVVDELADCFSCKKSFPFSQLLHTNLVIEVDGLSSQSERFLLAYLLLASLESQKVNSVRGNPSLDKDSIFFFAGEAASIWAPQLDFSERTREMSYDIIQEIPLIARDFKICLFFSSQRPLSENVMANTKTKIVSSLPEAKDAWYISNSFGVDPLIFQDLSVGEFIVKNDNREPFLIRTEKIEREILNNEQVAEYKRPFVELILQNCTPITKQKPQENDRTLRLNNDAKNLLVSVTGYPSLTVTQRYDNLSLKGKYAQEIKAFLKNQKLVEEVFLAVGSSKQSTFLVPTQRAIDYLKSNGVNTEFYKHIGKTSSLHQLIQAMLIEFFTRDNCIVRNDYQIAEKFVDVFIEKDNTRAVFEVAVNPSIDVERVKSSLGRIDYFVVVAADVMTLNRMEQSLKQLSSGKIKFYLASNLLAALKKRVLDYNTLNIVEQLNTKNNRITRFTDVEQEKNRSKN